MNKANFELWMNSIDKKYLEEAAMPPVKRNNYRKAFLAAAACLLLACTGLLFRHALLSKDGITKEKIRQDGETYTLLSLETDTPSDISGLEEVTAEPLAWFAGGLEIKLCSSEESAWVSWFDPKTSTQWCLTSEASTLSLLTTASEIVKELGYNITVAPEQATDITYDAFRLNDLTVAETSFILDGVRYNYRMASTYELTFPFADISGTAANYDTHLTTEVGWCPAELYYNEAGYGKIIWFDIAPGLLYSLSMETDASEEHLLTLAHELFHPAQDEADW